MIFRETDFLKSEKQIVRAIRPNLKNEELGRELRMREVKVISENGNIVSFEQGTYNRATGEANYKVKDLPFVLAKMTKLHKATTKEPLFFLNIFFGVSLLFFVISSFWMFLPKTTIFKKGLYFTLAGMVLTLIMVFL
jgi:hypothetical protein